MSDESPIRSVGTDEGDACAEASGASCPRDRPAGRPGSTQELAALLGRVALGDHDAFTEFYRSTSKRVFGLAMRIVRRQAAAEEITQEVYIHVWSAAGDYDGQLASPIGWLMMLTHRRSVDRLRVESSSATRDLAFGQRHLGRDHDIVAETVGQRAEERAVADCLRTLTATQRNTLALAYYGGQTYSEVADRLGIPLSTVKTRIRDGLKRLQNCLAGSETDA